MDTNLSKFESDNRAWSESDQWYNRYFFNYYKLRKRFEVCGLRNTNDQDQSSKFFSTLSGTFHFKWKVATPLHFPLWFLVFFHFFFHFLIKFIQFVFSEYAFGQKREIWGWRCKWWLIRKYGILLAVLWFITRHKIFPLHSTFHFDFLNFSTFHSTFHLGFGKNFELWV